MPDEIKQHRLQEIMEIQEGIAQELNEEKIGNTLKVIIDREEDEYYVGRTEFDSPEVDPEVLVAKNKELQIGEFYNVKITGALPFELLGEVVE